MAHSIVAFLCLLAVSHVFAFQCYITDPGSFLQGPLKETATDCNEFVRQVAQSVGGVVPPTIPDDRLACFKISIHAKDEVRALKGCMEVDKCDTIRQSYKFLEKFGDAQIDCHECRGSLCNGGGRSQAAVAAAILALVVAVF